MAQRKHPRLGLGLLATGIALVTGIAVAGLMVSPGDPGLTGARQASGPIAHTVAQVLSTNLDTPAPPASPTGRFKIPALNLDTNLIPTQIQNGAMALQDDPAPAYISAEPGLPIVVAVHSSNRRDSDGSLAIGNRLWDRDTQELLLPVGSELLVDGVRYVTTGFAVLDKNELAGASVFSGGAALLLVTCAQKSSGESSTDNLVITAVRG